MYFQQQESKIKKVLWMVNFCPKAFSQPGNLKNHQYKHSQIRPFSCPFCSSRFKQKGSLVTHAKKLHPEQTNACKPKKTKKKRGKKKKAVKEEQKDEGFPTKDKPLALQQSNL